MTTSTERAVLAGGCFWGMQDLFRRHLGVVSNAVMIKAHKDGTPANGKSVPDGAMMAKIEWQKARDPALAYGTFVPGALAEVAFMMKDSKRFPQTNGWGYATFKPDG